MNDNLKILLVDDDEDDYFLTNDYLTDTALNSFTLEWVHSYEEALPKMLSPAFDIILVDYRLGKVNGLDLLREALKNGCDCPVIMLTGKSDRHIDMESMKSGASDYLVKGEINPHILERSIRYALDRDKTKKIIEEQQKKYRNLFEQSIDAIFITDLSGYIIDANKSFFALLEYSESEIHGHKIEDVFSDAVVAHRFLSKTKKEGFVKAFEATITRNDNSKLKVSVSAVIIKDSRGNETGLQGIIHDLTILKKAERELRMAEKLSLTGRLARTIAHEVRNPLTNINLAIEQLKQEITGFDDIMIYPEIINRNSGRINELITKLLNSAKPSDVELQAVNPNLIIEETISLCMDRIRLQEVELQEEYCSNPRNILFDSEKIKIAFLNIITNAIEAMDETENPTLKITTCQGEGGDFTVSIFDNGKGMDEKTLSQLFDPFFTGKSTGMGLGMTTTQNIIKAHNGSIEVQSEPEKGSVFKIIFEPPT